ncbi:hypothetical protein N7470_009321 [Penicillium chermesinum]|nr:hypothetical protein N7470_009321 [Penicillium chermesinum]
MSKPVSLPVAQHQQLSYHSSRERELFKYLPSYLLERRNLPYVDRNTQSPESVAQPGPDSVLTALAQLGTLHLDSSRAFISLFGRHDQYILTEATRTLSLQDVTDSTAHRELWLGHCTISYERSLCSQFLDPTNDKLVVVPDTAQDEHYRDHQDVSRRGLEKQHARSERMMIGLRSFLDGKGSLRASWVTDNEDTFSPIEGFGEGHVNMEQQKKQISDNVNEAMDNKPPLRELPFRPSNFRSQRAHMLDAQSLQQRNLAPVNTNSRDIGSFDLKSAPSEINAKSVEISPKLAYKAQIKHAFSRASNIVRESIEVEAAVFFDANFGTQEVLVNVLQSDSESSGLETFSSTDDESQTKRKPLKRDLQKIVQNENAGKGTKNPCKVLGFSLSNASSLDQQSIEDENIALSEGFLGQLLRRYPRGKIFNYGEDGSISSEETGDSFFKPSFERNAGKKYKKTRKTTLRQDATLLLQLAPNARSIIFSPLWDSHKERWHSACISWTNIPHRILTPDDDLTFLFAFGHSLMAEIHRHEDQMAERAKRNLLSGISHELRSPLHGIFGTMDILNETAMNALQRGFMHTISSCAFTLLNSLDQLLMYASINDVPQNDQKAPPLRHNQFGPDVTFPLAGTDGDDAVQFDTAVENTIESVCAGYFFFDKDAENSIHFMADTAHTTSEPLGNRVIVIFDVNYNRSFSFLTRPGAWTVILTNVLGNALKFTRDGHVYVSLKSNPVQSDSAGPILQSDITVTVRDTGCGLNITGKMVDSLGGNIRINSEKGVGTEVVITVTLDHDMATTDPHDIQSRELLPSPSDFFARGKTIGIFGPDSSTADNYLFSSLKNLCQNWFHMDTRVAAPSREELGKCDYFILTQGLSDMSFLDSLFLIQVEYSHLRS